MSPVIIDTSDDLDLRPATMTKSSAAAARTLLIFNNDCLPP